MGATDFFNTNSAATHVDKQKVYIIYPLRRATNIIESLRVMVTLHLCLRDGIILPRSGQGREHDKLIRSMKS